MIWYTSRVVDKVQSTRKERTMNDTKHTPGPWEPCNIGDGKLSIIHNGPIAYTGDAGNNEGEANARLIAAAPDMLAALEKCRNMAESLLGCDGWRELLRNHSATSHDNWLGPDIHGIADTAQAAIRKATGGE